MKKRIERGTSALEDGAARRRSFREKLMKKRIESWRVSELFTRVS